jgi:very-short-patch-repair endonuclease
VVEVDGFAYHSSRRTFESDRRRDAQLAAAGLRVVRVTWRQINSEAEAMLVRLAKTLARSPATLGRDPGARSRDPASARGP